MTRTMYDGVDASRLPVSAQLVAGYVDGLYKWSDADWARFPKSVKARIAVFSSTDDGHVLDVEPGNATPAQSVDWVLMRRRAGVDPTVYMNTSTWPTVRGAFRSRNVAEPHYWVAQYDGVATIPAGAIGKQYYNNNALGYDLSVVADYWPGVDPAGEDMPLTQADIAAIFNYAFQRQGPAPSGETTLGGMVAWNDGHVQTIINQINTLSATVSKLSSPTTAAGAATTAATPAAAVDANSLATELAGNDAFVQAIADAVAARLNGSGDGTPSQTSGMS